MQGDSGNPTLVENFNPFSAASELGGTRLIYEPLEIASPIDGTFTPFLATDHRFTDPRTLVFTIRKGVTWSDGEPFTAADVVFTFRLLKQYPALDITGVWSVISSVAESGNLFTATFNTANVPFAATVAAVPIVPQHLWADIADPTRYANTTPVGTGPFTLSSFEPTQYALAKNPSYWQADNVAPATVLFPAQSTNQVTNQLNVVAGTYDWAYNYLPNVKDTYVSRDPDNIYWFPPGGTIGLFMNLTRAPYTDANFRKGVSLAIDRDLVAQKAVNGYTTGASMSGLVLPNQQKWLDPSLSRRGYVEQDLTAAKASFAKAGFTESNGRLVDGGGRQVSMTISMPANYSDWVTAAKETANQLGAVGISVQLDLPQAAQFQTEIQTGNFDVAMNSFAGTGLPYTDFRNGLASSFAAPINTRTVNNFERYKNRTLDQALATLAAATDEQTQREATYRLERIMYEQVPIVLLYYGGSWGLFSTRHFTGWPSAENPYTLPTSYNNSILVVLTRLKKA
ncbi:ABC transporter substrate-binding protein [Nakamurella endophytica]|uniref:ABC transporter substrate-binding protein n=2 Tax=Nakamurella endophytica TaxID=1748367 RepID=A0A917SN25_9ACTN|nr:ABC transporter substrate-binding protein [Nakamurella endophytica]